MAKKVLDDVQQFREEYKKIQAMYSSKENQRLPNNVKQVEKEINTLYEMAKAHRDDSCTLL